MSNESYGMQAGEIGALTKEQMSYGDYLCLDVLLSAQKSRSPVHDEFLFVIQHQTSELWMKLAIYEIRAAMEAIRGDRLAFASKVLVRVCRVFEQMTNAWDVLRTMTPTEFVQFREFLQQSSRFQSFQYRTLEFLTGNRNAAMLHPHDPRPDIKLELEAVLEKPSLYDETLMMLARNGLDIGADGQRTDWRDRRQSNDEVIAVWQSVYAMPERYWPVLRSRGKARRL